MGGISLSTGNEILYGTDGYLTVGGVDIGATLGDIEIEWPLTHYYPDLAQARGSVKGTGAVIEAFFRIRCTIAQHSWTTYAAIAGSVGADSTGASYKFGGQPMSIPVEVQNVAVDGIQRNDGKAFRAVIPWAYTEIGNLVMSEKQETGLEVTFHGLVALDNPNDLPGYILIEK